MQLRKLKRILKETNCEIIKLDKVVFRYCNGTFALNENYDIPWSIGSLRTFQFKTEAEVKKRFKKSKLFVKSCPDDDNGLTVTAFEWRQKSDRS